jgi:hypothetical protein
MRKLGFIFVFAFLLNLVWEFLHSLLYTHYQGGEITQIILIRASFWDAVIILIISIVFLSVPFLKRNSWIMVPVGIVWAVIIESYALGTGRWDYGSNMPLIFGLGLTPLIQLGLTGYVTFLLANSLPKKH